MSGLRLLALGVGDAFSARYYSSCFALEAEGSWLLVDCPHPIRKILREAGETAGVPLDLDRFLGVVLTHLHADHSSGLEGLGFYSRYVLGRPARLLTHPSVAEKLWQGHLAGGMEEALQEPGKPPEVRALDQFFDLSFLSETVPAHIGPFVIRCRPTIHMVPTVALYIEAAGRQLGYSADTAFDAALIDWLTPADLIVHETNPGFMHTPYDKLLSLPAIVRNKMHVVHYPDNFDAKNSTIPALHQGHWYPV